MDAVKRASFTSKQLPAGPAPLASFEDLPSDELESPEESGVSKHTSILSEGNASSENQEETTSDCNTFLSTNTPDTLPISNLSTPQVDSDFDSHCTLTPVDCNKAHSASEFRTSSLSSLPKEDDTSLTKQKKGSVVSLGNYEISETEFNQRKSSWTDIFRSHNQAPKFSSDQVVSLESKSKFASKKKNKTESIKQDNSEIKPKERGKFLAIFKSGKKSNKNIDVVPDSCLKFTSEDKKIIQSFEGVTCEKLDSEPSEGKENEQPKQIELLPVQFQNDLDKSSAINPDLYKLPISSKENDMRNNLNIAEKEYNIFSGQNEEVCEKAINKEKSDEKEVQDGHESSESELAFDIKDQTLTKKDDDDFEKENLLAQDSSEIEDDPSLELNPIHVFTVPPPVSKLSRQQRLEVTTVPIDRPRSTTPINIAPLEAFIRSASPSFDPKVEKIKLTLPGEQFLGRMKSPKRNAAKSWADFCEEGLHSPRMQKKGDDFHLPQDTFESKSTPWDNFKMSDKEEWVTFESKTEREDTPDLFRDLPIEETVFDEECEMSSAIQPVTKLSKCSCECHSHGCENSYIKANEHFSSTGSIKVDVFSDKCQCQCHERYVHLWSPTDTNSGDLLSEICDTLKSSEFASDFAPSLAAGHF